MPTRDSKEIFRPYNRPREVRENMRRIIVDRVGNIQTDLMFMPRYKKHNKNIEAIFVWVDVYSRYCWATPLKNRRKETLTKAFENWISGLPFKVITLTSDNEFNKAYFHAIAIRHGFRQYFSDPKEKFRSSIAERQNRNIRDLIKHYMVEHNTRNWIDALPMLIKKYNHTVHTAHRATPHQILTGQRQPHFHDPKTPKRRIIVGDRVRHLIDKGIFDKGDKPRYSPQVYRVAGYEGLRFILMDLDGVELKKRYSIHQLQKVSLRSKRPEFFQPKQKKPPKASKEVMKKLEKPVRKKIRLPPSVKVRKRGVAPAYKVDKEPPQINLRRSTRKRKLKHKSLAGMG